MVMSMKHALLLPKRYSSSFWGTVTQRSKDLTFPKANLKLYLLQKMQKVLALTHTNNFLNLYAGGINFFGKFPHGLIWILICKRIHICSDTCKAEMFYLKSLIYMLLNTEHMRLKS